MNQLVWRLILILLILAELGCVTVVSERARELAVTDESLVKQCRALGEFSGGSLMAMVDPARGQYNAEVEVLENAVKAGATHIVWQEKTGLAKGTAGVRAKAYNCERYQLAKISYRRPNGDNWKYYNLENGLQGFCRKLDQQNPPSTLCLAVTWGDTSQVSNQFKSANEFFVKVNQLKKIDADSGRMKLLAYNSKRIRWKEAECLEFNGKSEDLKMKETSGVHFVMYTRGKNCLVPNDPKAWADFYLSARVREGTPWEFTAEDLKLLDGVELGGVK